MLSNISALSLSLSLPLCGHSRSLLCSTKGGATPPVRRGHLPVSRRQNLPAGRLVWPMTAEIARFCTDMFNISQTSRNSTSVAVAMTRPKLSLTFFFLFSSTRPRLTAGVDPVQHPGRKHTVPVLTNRRPH